MKKMLSNLVVLAAVGGCALLAAHAAPILTPLYSFTGTSGHKDPVAALVKGNDGNYYGTAWQGGDNSTGSVFRYAPTTGIYTNLHSFSGPDGANPYASLMYNGNDGFFYGSTVAGGANGLGTLFKISPSAAFPPPLTTLYSFGGGSDGASPYGGLMLLGDGKIYGTTADGGSQDYGTLFVWDPTTLTKTTLHTFTSQGNDGGWPYGSLVAGPSDTTGNVDSYNSTGNLIKRTITTHYYFYGTTWGGGGNLQGSVFQFLVTYYWEWDWSAGGVLLAQITAQCTYGPYTTLYSFAGGADGANPYAGLVKGSDGNYYGTTTAGGTNNCGTMYYITTGGGYNRISSVPGGSKGANPYGQLVVGAGSGNFFGTTLFGGIGDNGSIFKATTGGTFTNLYNFTGVDDGGSPFAGLMSIGPGVFAGTAGAGSQHGLGGIYSFMPDGAIVTVTATPPYGGVVTGGGTYLAGQLIWIQAVANTNYAFMGWSDGLMDNPRAVTVPSTNVAFNAVFQMTADVTVLPNPMLGGAVTGAGRFPTGLVHQISAAASPGWVFAGWEDGGLIDNPRTVIVPPTNITYIADFTQQLVRLSVRAQPVSGGSVTGAGTFPIGTAQQISATPNGGWQFGSWDDGNTNPVRSIILGSNDVTATASFIQPSTVLTLLVNTNVGGTAIGAGSYAEGSVQTISAIANAGWQFIQWSDGSVANPRNIIMPVDNITYTAIFQKSATIMLQASPGIGGTASGGGNFLVGQSVQLLATANSNWVFTTWSGAALSGVNPLVFTVASNAVYTANFQQLLSIITVLTSSTNGTVLGSGTFPAGSTQAISATPNAGWGFSSWDDGNTQNPRSIIVPANNVTYTAIFAPLLATVTVQVNTNIGGVAAGGGIFPVGSTRPLTATAYPGWTFTGWNDANLSNPRSITVPASNITYTAVFAQQMSTVTLLVNLSQGGIANGGGSFPIGSTQTISGVANTGWRFTQWTDGSALNPRSIVVPASNVTYTAVFASSARITVAANPANAGTVGGGGLYPVNSTQTLTAVASPGWVFTSWTSGSFSTSVTPLGIAVLSNTDYIANFTSSSATVTVRPNPPTAGTASGGGTYPVGSTQQLAAVGNPGWTFTGWNDGISSNPRGLIVPSNNITFLANFTSNGLATAGITVTCSPAGSASVIGSGTFSVGTSVLIGATPSNGWSFFVWSDGDLNTQRYVLVPSGGGTYTAIFRPIMGTVNVAANPATGGSVSGAGAYQVGSNVTLTATANSGWVFTGWSDGKVANPRPLTVAAGFNTYYANFSPTLGAALGLQSFVWGTGGDADWFGETGVKHAGIAAAQSGAIGNNQVSWLVATTNGPGSIVFWWKVSSQANHDFFSFIMENDNGYNTTNRISGNVDWTEYACFFGDGSHTCRWEYAKDASGVAGADAGYLSEVAWFGVPAATNTPALFFQDTSSGLLASWVLNGAGAHQFTRILGNISGWQLKTAGDVDGDGTSDLLLQNPAGEVMLWFMNADGTIRSTRDLGPLGGWEVRAVADFTGSLQNQIFFQNSSGLVAYWMIDTNGTPTNSAILGNMGAWRLQAAADLDNDHKAELLWQTPTGTTAVWFHTNSTIRAVTFPGNMGVWGIRGALDATNGVGVIAWQTPDGNTATWLVNSNVVPATAVISYGGTGGWKLKAFGH